MDLQQTLRQPEGTEMTAHRTDIDVRSRASGEQRRFAAGHVVQLKRDAAADFPLRHETTSRRSHAELAWADGHGWVLRDVSARVGMFVGGVAQQVVLVDRPTLVRLGTADAGEDLELNPVGAVDPVRAARMTVLSTQTVMAPQVSTSAPWRLAVTVGSETMTFDHRPGRSVSIGRDPACDVTVDDARASRYHADLICAPDGWRYEDHSTGGSWFDGKRKATALIDRSVDVKLGDPLTGLPLRLEVATPPAVERRRERKARSVKLAAAAGGVAVVAAVATVLSLLVGGSSSSSTPTTISSDTLLAVENATVKLEIIGSDGESAGWGSGSIIDAHGMILTNAHVADPNALGQTTQYGSPPNEKDPDYLLVELRGSNPDGTVEPRYRARKVVSDGYLDLAIVQIYADAKGNKVDPATLDLPAMDIGDSDELTVGDEVTVVGFPGVSQSRAATVTKGDASAFVRDARLKSDRAWIETTARIAHGNSGGAAVDASGALIGVPTRLAPEHEGDVGWWFRPVNWANRLITLARNHQGADYVTPYVTPASGVTITPLDWTEERDDACDTDPNPYVEHTDGDTSEMYVGVRVSGLAKGLTFNISINGPVGFSTNLTATSDGPASGCYSVPVAFDKGNGRYVVAFSVDPPGTSTEYAAIVVGN